MGCRHPISFGDLLRAFDCVGGEDDATRRAVASLLGFEFSEMRAREAEGFSVRVPTADEGSADTPRTTPQPEDDAARQTPSATEKAAAPPDDARDNAWVEPLSPKSLRMPEWYDAVQPLSD